VGGQLRSPALLDVAVAAAGLLDRLLHVTVALEVALAAAAGLEEEEVVTTRLLYDILVIFLPSPHCSVHYIVAVIASG
jgi:hypothetical protein